MRRLTILTAAAAALIFASSSPAVVPAQRCGDRWELHAGSCGQRVKDLQWLLAGHRPNVFTEVKPTFKWKPNGSFGARTKTAVTQYKWRIGYPQKGQCGATLNMATNPSTGPQFFAILKGKKKRPACWVALVSGRLKAIAAAQPTKTALAVRALELDWLGITENPAGSNGGPCISSSCTWKGKLLPALQSSTGAYRAAWCVSTQQTAFLLAGYGRFANGTASVYYAVDFYAARNLLFAKPKVGSLVAFIDYDSRGRRIPGTGHMGFVVKVEANSFTYTAGNDANGVREHTIPDGSRPYVFIRLPRVA